jgi:hypothetical protein
VRQARLPGSYNDGQAHTHEDDQTERQGGGDGKEESDMRVEKNN